MHDSFTACHYGLHLSLVSFNSAPASSFSNGDLDPWSGGGVLQSISDTLVAVVIPDGAHHLDLRAATPEDPPDVTEARILEESYIRKWSSQK